MILNLIKNLFGKSGNLNNAQLNKNIKAGALLAEDRFLYRCRFDK
jgi:hypothetical protein